MFNFPIPLVSSCISGESSSFSHPSFHRSMESQEFSSILRLGRGLRVLKKSSKKRSVGGDTDTRPQKKVKTSSTSPKPVAKKDEGKTLTCKVTFTFSSLVPLQSIHHLFIQLTLLSILSHYQCRSYMQEGLFLPFCGDRSCQFQQAYQVLYGGCRRQCRSGDKAQRVQ